MQDAKRCPMARLDSGEMDYCIQEACAWWVEGRGCAVAVLAMAK